MRSILTLPTEANFKKIGAQCVHVSVMCLFGLIARGNEGNARFAKKGHLRFVSVAFGFYCGR